MKESLSEMHFRAMIELGGGQYQGIFEGNPEIKLEPLVLFSGPSRSTLALKPQEVSADNVRRAIAAKEAEFEAFAPLQEQIWAAQCSTR